MMMMARTALCCRSAYVYRHRITPFWMAWEAAIAALMWAALGVFFAYAAHISAHSSQLELGFEAYDALASAPARYFLSARQNGTLAVPIFEALASGSKDAPASAGEASASAQARSSDGIEDAALLNAALAQLSEAAANVSAKLVSPSPGEPLRWQLPEARGGLVSAAGMVVLLQRLYALYCTYSLLQGFILVLMIVRWLHYISFQPRLSIISGTLALAMKVGGSCTHARTRVGAGASGGDVSTVPCVCVRAGAQAKCCRVLFQPCRCCRRCS